MLSLKNKYSPAIAIILLAFVIFIFSCKKDKDIVVVDLGYNYFPDKKVTFVIYQVDSLFYNDFTSTIDTFQFQIKEKMSIQKYLPISTI